MRKMGGLWNKLPITCAAMLIGTIAITGLGIPGLDIGFAGFYSKDAILAAAFDAGHTQAYGYFAYIVGTFVAGLTAYYSWRLAFMTFNGTAKWSHAANGDSHGGAHVAHPDDHATAAQHETHSEPDVTAADRHDGHGHGDFKPHESPWVMLVPLVVLSVGAICAGGVFTHMFIGEGRENFWRGAIFTAPHNTTLDHIEHLPMWVGLLPLIASIGGLLIAAYYYLLHEGLAARMAANNGLLYRFLYNKWYFDEVYYFIFVRGAKGLGDLFWKNDAKVIDRFGPDGVAAASSLVGRVASKVQSGYVYHYAFVMLLGVAGLLTFVLMSWR
jgi:NADH-quinone oxidoreductase subunit L